jgi:TPR repeat protein
MFKLFKKDKETVKEEEWISILKSYFLLTQHFKTKMLISGISFLFQKITKKKENGISLTQGEIQKARQNDGKSLFNIGYGYLDSKKDDAKAFAWFYKAALENYDKAQSKVGFMYKKGRGVSQDYKLAIEWYQKAASNGNSNAQYNTGVMYHKGQGVSQDYKLAMGIFQKAASNGNSDAQFSIGYMYDKGQGVPQDYKLAMDWYQKADSNGITDAQNNIGCLYKYGRGVSQDYKLASEWYQKAADNNHEKAKKSLEQLKEQINDAKEEHKGIIYLYLLYDKF